MSFKTSYLNTELSPFYMGGSLASLSEDGAILATAVLEDIVITDLSMNETLHKLEGDGEMITALQMTPDGKYLAVISQSQQLRIFNLHESKFVKSFKLSSPVFVTCADPTSTLFALGGSDGVVIVFDIENGFVTHSFKGHGSTISALKFHGELNSKDWKLASGDTNGLIKIWDLTKRKSIANLNEHGNAVRGLSFNGNFFISGGRDDLLIIWDSKTWKSRNIISAKQQIEACGFINDELMYTAGGDAILKIWNIKNGHFVTQTEKPIEELLIIGVLPDLINDKLLLILSDQTLFEIDITTIEEGETIEISKKIAGNHGTIADMRYVGPNKNLIALATNSPGLRIIDPVNKPLEVEILEGHQDLLNALDSTYDGLWIATASKDNEARLWRYNEVNETFQTVAVFKGHAGSISAISLPRSTEIGNQPKFLLTGSNDLTVKKWKVPKFGKNYLTEEPIVVKTSEFTRRAHEKDINSIDISPNDEFFATASFDKTGKVWDLDSGETIGILKGHKRGLWDVKFCKYDKLLITGSGDKTLKLWSLNDEFKCLKTFEGHTNSVQRVDFLNKEKQIVSTGADGLIKIWDCSSGECLKTLDMHSNRIWSIIIKNNGEEFVTADADGVFQFWIDNTEEVNKEEEELMKLKVEQEQSLQNFINDKNWKNAFLLALKLDHPMRLYNVLKSCINENTSNEFIIGEDIDSVIKTLTDEQILLLFKRIRNWNVNARFFLVSQKLIKVILKSFKFDKLIEIPGIMNLIDSLVPYNERHYSRLDDLIEQSFILDYSIEEMNKVI